MSMVATKSKAAEVMWKIMMKARSTNIFTGCGGARGHDETPETERCAERGERHSNLSMTKQK